MRWKEMLKDKKGVSPVIGVILMVAITVILAAVIASFVFGMGTKIRAAPEAQLVLSDHEDVINTNEADNLVYISHIGGDTLKCDELKIKVTNKGTGTSYVLTWDSDNSCFKDSEDNLVLYVNSSKTNLGNKYYITTSGLLQVGDTATLSEGDSGKDFVNAVPATLEIQIIHIPSNTIIYTGEVLVQ